HMRFSLLPPLPRPSLLPYTTLFRSGEPPREPGQGPDEGRPIGQEVLVGAGPVDRRVGVADPELPTGQGVDLDVHDGGVPPDRDPDRKSTRLNSSHVKISYAVFCLKK